MNSSDRYSCQLLLPGFDEIAQKKLADARVLVVGAGGLGCPALQYLASTGIGMLGIADHDVVSVKNLHRQILYGPGDVGEKKCMVARERLLQQNSGIEVNVYDAGVNYENVTEIFSSYDIVVDCTDNFDTRYLLNDAAVISGKPLVYGAIYQYEGQVAVWNVQRGDKTFSPNYRDLYPDVNASAVPDCAEGGVMPTVAGIVGCTQANEVIKYITNTGKLLTGKLLIIDVQTMQSRVMKLSSISKVKITTLPDADAVQEISYETIQASPEKYNLVDVRTAEERADHHIGGTHIPLPEINTAQPDTAKPVVCYCATGKRSATAVKILSKRFPGIIAYSLKGGISK